jgi:phosphinothricin acetyltransferase
MVLIPLKDGTRAPFGPRHGRDQADECTCHVGTTTAVFGRFAYYCRAAMSDNSSTFSIRLATVDDSATIRRIYNHEVENYTSTTDLVPRSLAAQRAWLSERSGAFSAVVAVNSATGEVVGFASLSPFKERAAYRTTVENSVYVSREHGGRGIGRLLMTHLIEVARDSGFHSMIGRIEATSLASRALHEACGFELVGIERQVGRKFNRWIDIAVMQLML